MTAPVTIRDRRTLPFFQVRLRPLQEIRNEISGPRRARALGLYVLLCQMANEQRATGEHAHLTTTYAELTRRGALSPNSLKVLLGALDDAGAARLEVRVDRLRGSLPSIIRLPVQDGPWAGVTVAMAERLGSLTAIRPLSALGFLVILLEFCDDQREALGGLAAETTRTEIARRLGCGTDSLDDWTRALESSGVLAVTRRRAPGGVQLPNLWEIHEAPSQTSGSVEAVVVGAPADDSARAESKKHHHGEVVVPGPSSDTAGADPEKCPSGGPIAPRPTASSGPADLENCPSGESAAPASIAPRVNAPGRDQPELSATEEQPPPTPATTHDAGERGRISDLDPVGLCDALLEVLGTTRGPGPSRLYAQDPVKWQAAAARILTDHPADKVLAAIAHLECDQIVGTKVRSMPDLEKHIEDLRHRAHAAGRAGSLPRSGSDGSSWASAHALLRQAAGAYGPQGADRGLQFIAARDPQLAAFVDHIGWRTLTGSDAQMTDIKFAYLNQRATDRPEAA